MRFAIIVANPPHSAYFLFDEDGDTKYFESADEAQSWIDHNRQSVSDYFIWDCSEASILN